ncbi:HAD hydrolase-like protein [Spirosoma sp. RP8]|uniref:HAD hydrolase-like protein n=1 Tax=Spirosoma liriopis TaxID=2937440 RepID=A0ABT0HMZ2_9BACT|nr:HAD family hydrolase [Spirosoma liriopis]MCK8493536.1 HAD hydrolase-like protein [Spirosoma liriopis]
MQPIELVVFDMAGTTVTDHHEVEQCFAQAAAETGLIASAERILAMQGLSKRYVFDTLWKEQLGEMHPDVPAHVDISYATFQQILERHYRVNGATPTEGCLDTFAYLRERGIAIALTTGFYRVVTDIILEKLGWLNGLDRHRRGTSDSLIQLSIASDEVERGRPYPLMIERAIDQLGISSPKAVVNIGDTPSDLLSGQAAGVVLNLGVTNGTHSKEQLETYPHDRLIGSLRDLPALLDSHAVAVNT